MSEPATPERETSGRTAFLDRLRTRLATGIPENHTHPLRDDLGTPSPRFLVVDHDDLIGSFTRTAVDAGCIVERLAAGWPRTPDRFFVPDPGPPPDSGTKNGTRHDADPFFVPDPGPAPGSRTKYEVVDDSHVAAFVERHRIERAVVSAEPEAVALGAALARLGIEVHPSNPRWAAEADLGVTSAVAMVAATGSLVVRSDVAGSRTVSLLPRVHLCVAPVDRVVATPADVFGRLAGRPAELPSNLVLITGPSRTGDIEQILTRGVHGPVTVHVLLTD